MINISHVCLKVRMDIRPFWNDIAFFSLRQHGHADDHILDKYSVHYGGVIDHHVCHRSYELAVLNDGRAAHECGQVGTTFLFNFAFFGQSRTPVPTKLFCIGRGGACSSRFFYAALCSGISAAFSIFSMKMPYPTVGSFIITCVTAPTSLPF